MDLALVLVEDTVYVRRRVGSRTFEVGDLWDCFVVGGLVVEAMERAGTFTIWSLPIVSYEASPKPV